MTGHSSLAPDHNETRKLLKTGFTQLAAANDKIGIVIQ